LRAVSSGGRDVHVMYSRRVGLGTTFDIHDGLFSVLAQASRRLWRCVARSPRNAAGYTA
jgi:hypothetical protein